MPFGDAIAKDLAGRSLRLIIRPRPRTLHESRQILEVLQKYGEVTFFRNQRYDKSAIRPTYILAIYKHEESAKRIIADSPLTVALSDAALESLERSWAKDTRSQWLEQQADSDDDHNFRPEHIPSTRKVARTEWPKKIQDIWARWDEQAAELKQQRKAEGLPPIEPGMAKMPNLRALSRVWGDWKRAHPDADPQEKIHTHMEILATRSHFSHQAWIKRQPYYGPFVVDYDSRVEDDPGASRERDNRGRGRTFVAHQGDGNVAASDRRPALLGIKTWPLTPEFDPKTHARVHNRGLKERLRKMNLDTRSLGEMWREGQARREAGAEAKAAKLAADEARREAEIEARAARIAADEARKAERAAMLEEQADDDDGERKLMDPEDDVPRQL